MAEDQPGPPGGSRQDDRPGQRPTEPLGGPTPPTAPLPGGAPSPPSPDGGVNLQFQPAPGPFILVELAYFTFFHATGAGQSIGNKILGIRVLDADTGRSLPYARAVVRALMSNLSALPCFLGFLWMLWEPPQADLA